jgi:LysR family glycine cleavage system transcriptional activator
VTDRMITRIPPLRALAAFEAAARSLSFQKAAAELNVTPPAISQQIKVLEEYFGTALFRRLNRRMLLTEAGEIYYASISSAFSVITEATERVQRHLSPQILMIRSSPSFAAKWLLRRLPEFTASHPGIEVRLDASNEKTDFAREAVDLEIRAGNGGWPGLHVEPLFRESIVPLATPGLIEAHGLRRPADLLTGVPLIHSVKCPVGWEMWFAANELPVSASAQGYRFDRSFMAIEAAADGIGVALDSETLAEAELRSGRLVVPFRGRAGFVRQILWFVCPFPNLERRAVALFRRWLFENPDVQKGRTAADRRMPA